MKRCPQCGVERPLEDFARDKRKASGRACWCRACDNAKSKRYYEANRETKLEYMNRRNALLRQFAEPRKCARCGEPATSNRHFYCDPCREARKRHKQRMDQRLRDKKRPPLRERGYGPAHFKLRKSLAPMVAAGGYPCARCGEPILAGEKWDLGHDDFDRSRYSGPEHVRCNRATASRVPKQAASRRW